MAQFQNITFFKKIVVNIPILILFVSVLNEFDFNYLEDEVFFHLIFHLFLIFYWSLKKSEILGYGYIFIAGLVNDVVIGFPIGVSSFCYLLICGFAAYLRNITLRPKMFQDWIFFLFTIFVTNSSNVYMC